MRHRLLFLSAAAIASLGLAACELSASQAAVPACGTPVTSLTLADASLPSAAVAPADWRDRRAGALAADSDRADDWRDRRAAALAADSDRADDDWSRWYSPQAIRRHEQAWKLKRASH